MTILVTTTGTLSPVIIPSLGNLELVHPIVDLDLYDELRNKDFKIYGNPDLLAAEAAGYITIENQDGSPVDISDPIGANLGSQVSYRELTMTGNLTLTKNDVYQHYLDPGGSNRFVDLPNFSDAVGKIFRIYHVGNNKRIDIRENGTKIGRVRKGKAFEVVATNVAWTIYQIGSTANNDDDDDDD